MWNNVCVEGFCLGDKGEDDRYPCGMKYPTAFCLSNKYCPHFGYSETTERDVAHFVPIRIILWDRLKTFVTETAYWKLRWWFWDCLWFNRRKTREFFKNIPAATAEDCPALADMEKEEEANIRRFKKWLPKAIKEGNKYLREPTKKSEPLEERKSQK